MCPKNGGQYKVQVFDKYGVPTVLIYVSIVYLTYIYRVSIVYVT